MSEIAKKAEKSYPIAESFLSVQGEGQWAGSLMYFIRFAGCSVGIPFRSAEERKEWLKSHPEDLQLKVYQEKCCSSLTEVFICDTNFRQTAKMTISELLDVVGDAPRVCLTGGEPLMHDLGPLVQALGEARKIIHLETSGTIEVPEFELPWPSYVWTCISPKYKYLPENLIYCDEIKVLVGPGFIEGLFVEQFKRHFHKVFIQPINDEFDLRTDNLRRCLELQRKYPMLRLSSQLHKIWRVR